MVVDRDGEAYDLRRSLSGVKKQALEARLSSHAAVTLPSVGMVRQQLDHEQGWLERTAREETLEAESIPTVQAEAAQAQAIEAERQGEETQRALQREYREARPEPSGNAVATVAAVVASGPELQSQGDTPEQSQAMAKPERPAASSHSLKSESHMPDSPQEYPTETTRPGTEHGQRQSHQESPGTETPRPASTAAQLSWSQRLERLLPNDLPTLKSLWELECRRRFEQVKDKAQRVEDHVRQQLDRQSARRRAHREAEPKEPTGLFSRFQQTRYHQEWKQWEKRSHALDWRWIQLDRRLKRVMDYGREGLRRFGGYASRGENLAEKKVRAERPELARKLQQVQKQEDKREMERRRQEQEQRRQRERERGPSRGMER